VSARTNRLSALLSKTLKRQKARVRKSVRQDAKEIIEETRAGRKSGEATAKPGRKLAPIGKARAAPRVSTGKTEDVLARFESDVAMHADVARGRSKLDSPDLTERTRKPAVTRVTGKRGFERVSAESLKRMMGGEGERFEALKRSLRGAGDDIIEAVNRFHDVQGFDQVIADYLVGGNKQEGARFVMRQLWQTVPEDLTRATMFEVPDLRAFDTRFLDPNRATRVTDVWVAGERIEFKSVMDIRAYAGQQLRRDIISAGLEVGQGSGDVASMVAALKRRKWVFNATKMNYAGLSPEVVAERLSDFAFAKGSILAGHPWERELRAAVREIVVFR
jgi:hypothetical protein